MRKSTPVSVSKTSPTNELPERTSPRMGKEQARQQQEWLIGVLFIASWHSNDNSPQSHTSTAIHSSRYGHHTRRLNELIWLPGRHQLVLCLVLIAIIYQSTNHDGKPHDTPHASHTPIGENNNRRIVRNKASIYIVPNRTNAYDLHICAGQRCSDVLVHICNLFEAERCTASLAGLHCVIPTSEFAFLQITEGLPY